MCFGQFLVLLELRDIVFDILAKEVSICFYFISVTDNLTLFLTTPKSTLV